MTNLAKEINFVANTSSNKTYLVTNFNALQLIDFQIEMINRNVDGAFLHIEKRQFNSEIQLYYETTSLISMDSYFRTNRISRKNFLDILKNLCLALVKAEEQYLSINNYVLDIDKIFIVKESLQVKYIYIPIEQNYNLNVNEAFKDMIKDIIVDYANIDDTYSDHYLQKMLNFLKKEKITIKEFYDFFLSNVSKDMGPILKEQNNIQGIIGDNRGFNNQSNEVKQNFNNEPINNNPIQVNNNSIQMNNNQFQGLNNLKKSKTEASEEIVVKEVYKTASIIISAVVGLISVIFAVLAFVLLNNLGISEKFGVVLILAVIDFLVFRTLLDKKNKIKVKVKKKIDMPTSNKKIGKSNNLSDKKPANNINMDNSNLNNNINNSNNFNMDNSIPNNNNNFNMDNGIPNNNINNTNNFNMNNGIPNNNIDNINMANVNNDNQINNVHMQNNNLSSKPQEIVGLNSELLESNEDETMILSTNEAYLLSNDLGETKKIYIENERFRLGRLSTQVDYAISNKAIGKVHAEIVNQKGMYYIIDLNSKNGTFINRNRIDSNVPCPLNDDDEIMIANVKYIFKLY